MSLKPTIQPFVRSEQILRALIRNGPMSVPGLQRILEPEIEYRALHAAVLRLHQRGLLERRMDHPFGTTYHYISRKPSAVSALSKLLDIPREKIRLPFFRHSELLHSQTCAFWQHRLERLFPGAKVLREHEFHSDIRARTALMRRKKDFESRPDLLILHPAETKDGDVAVGVEIERFVKSRIRLVRKLDGYVRRSELDGLLYVCTNDTIVETLRTVWRSKMLSKAIRVNHYKQNFLLFSRRDWPTRESEPVMHNAALEERRMSAWMNQLAKTSERARRDAMFTNQ